MTPVFVPQTETLDGVSVNQLWERRPGQVYLVTGFSNEHTTNPEFPVSVSYQGNNGRRWTRPLAQFKAKFTCVGTATSQADTLAWLSSAVLVDCIPPSATVIDGPPRCIGMTVDELKRFAVALFAAQTAIPVDPLAGHPMLFLEELGFSIKAHEYLPDKWTFSYPTGETSMLSFASADAALKYAWEDALDQALAQHLLGEKDLAAMSFDDQKLLISLNF